MPDFSISETKLLNALADGKPHSVDELMGCLWDELASRGALLALVCRVRKKLRPHNQFIRAISATEVHQLAYVHVVEASCR